MAEVSKRVMGLVRRLGLIVSWHHGTMSSKMKAKMLEDLTEAMHWTPDNVKIIRKAFDDFCVFPSNKIAVDSVIPCLHKLGIKTDTYDVAEVVEDLNANHVDLVDFIDFAIIVAIKERCQVGARSCVRHTDANSLSLRYMLIAFLEISDVPPWELCTATTGTASMEMSQALCSPPGSPRIFTKSASRQRIDLKNKKKTTGISAAQKLLTCVQKVIQATKRAQLQSQLQDMVLDLCLKEKKQKHLERAESIPAQPSERWRWWCLFREVGDRNLRRTLPSSATAAKEVQRYPALAEHPRARLQKPSFAQGGRSSVFSRCRLDHLAADVADALGRENTCAPLLASFQTETDDEVATVDANALCYGYIETATPENLRLDSSKPRQRYHNVPRRNMRESQNETNDKKKQSTAFQFTDDKWQAAAPEFYSLAEQLSHALNNPGLKSAIVLPWEIKLSQDESENAPYDSSFYSSRPGAMVGNLSAIAASPASPASASQRSTTPSSSASRAAKLSQPQSRPQSATAITKYSAGSHRKRSLSSASTGTPTDLSSAPSSCPQTARSSQAEPTNSVPTSTLLEPGLVPSSPIGEALRHASGNTRLSFQPILREQIRAPEATYFGACSAEGEMPKVLLWLARRTLKNIDLQQTVTSGAGDEGLGPIVTVVTELRHTVGRVDADEDGLCRSLDLSNNPGLTAAGLNKVFPSPPTGVWKSLSSLSLGKNPTLRLQMAVDAIARELPVAAPVLEHLDFSELAVPPSVWPHLIESFLSWAPTLKRLALGATKLGAGSGSQVPCQNLFRILPNLRLLEELDISQNQFGHAGLEALATAMREVKKLKCLNLAGTAGGFVSYACEGVPTLPRLAAPEGHLSRLPPALPVPRPKGDETTKDFHPMQRFCEALSQNKTLEKLDLSSCKLGYAEAFLLETAMLRHPRLKELQISDNPVGHEGLECLMRCVVVAGELEWCDAKGLRNSTLPQDVGVDGLCVFNPSNPSAQYVLDLSVPLHRAYLKRLLLWCFRWGFSTECIGNIKYNGKDFTQFATLVQRIDDPEFLGSDWTVPMSGILTCTFKVFIPADGATAQEALHNYECIGREFVGIRRFSVLAALYKELGNLDEKLAMVEALSRTVWLQLAQLRFFVNNSKGMPTNDLITSLLPCLDSQQSVLGTLMSVMGLVRKAQHAEIIQTKARQFLNFNPDNPTDRYEMNLQIPTDQTCARHVLMLNLWEVEAAKRLKRNDTSQYGDRSNLRNVVCGGSVVHDSMSWTVPPLGTPTTVEADFASVLRAAPGEALSGTYFSRIVELLGNSPVAHLGKVCALRSFSHCLVLSCEQFIELLLGFPDENDGENAQVCPRIEIFIVMFSRCSRRDKVCSPKLMYNPEIFDRMAVRELWTRLGPLNTFDARHCCQRTPSNLGSRFSLDLAVYEDHQIANFLIVLSSQELGESLVECSWSEAAVVLSHLETTFLIPMAWVEEIPKKGVFSCRYICQKEEYAKPEIRIELADKFLSWAPFAKDPTLRPTNVRPSASRKSMAPKKK